MKVTGFTFIKDAIKYDYPIVEAITSILPICDEFVVAVGNSSDNTLQLIQNIHTQKIRIVKTQWDESKRVGGHVLAEETNKAFAEISKDSTWAFYIQGDEVVHEKYLPVIYNSMLKYKDDYKTDGLLFNYLHFYGSYDYVGNSSNWYSHEIRVIKNNATFYSYKDAQGFRKGDNQKLNVRPIDAYIYHYGWVKEPKSMQEKQLNFNKYWHNDEWIDEFVIKADEFDYSAIDALAIFQETHPAVMENRIKAKNWKFDYDLSRNKISLKEKVKKVLKRVLGLNFNYKNYKII